MEVLSFATSELMAGLKRISGITDIDSALMEGELLTDLNNKYPELSVELGGEARIESKLIQKL